MAVVTSMLLPVGVGVGGGVGCAGWVWLPVQAGLGWEVTSIMPRVDMGVSAGCLGGVRVWVRGDVDELSPVGVGGSGRTGYGILRSPTRGPSPPWGRPQITLLALRPPNSTAKRLDGWVDTTEHHL